MLLLPKGGGPLLSCDRTKSAFRVANNSLIQAPSILSFFACASQQHKVSLVDNITMGSRSASSRKEKRQEAKAKRRELELKERG